MISILTMINRARKLLQIESAAIQAAAKRLDKSFDQAVEAILNSFGHIIVCGVGKPWFIAQKISATLASTGTLSFPLHPAEAVHGDIGRVRHDDVVICLSNSGSSDEILRIIPSIGRLGATLIAITGQATSPLGEAADITIDIGPIEEACPLGLAPSASSTAMLAVGDALALVVLEQRKFTREDYARFHPAGALGRKLMKVCDVMRSLEHTPTVNKQESLLNVLQQMTSKRSGMACILDNNQRLLGIFTDGDLRRHVSNDPVILHNAVSDYMTPNPIIVKPDESVGKVQRLMIEQRIDEIPVVSNNILLGYIDAQDFLDVTHLYIGK